MTPDYANLPIRDIHLPDPVAWWPPAPGWWILLLCLLLGGIVLFRWSRRRAARQKLYTSAMQAFSRLEQDYQLHGDTRRLTESLSVLLRRISLTCYPQTRVASLTAAAWLDFLNDTCPGEAGQPLFDQDQGKALTEGPYNPALTVDGAALLAKARIWITTVTRQETVK